MVLSKIVLSKPPNLEICLFPTNEKPAGQILPNLHRRVIPESLDCHLSKMYDRSDINKRHFS